MTIPIMTREQWEERIRYETIDENEPGKPRTAHPYYIVDTRKLWVPVTEALPENGIDLLITNGELIEHTSFLKDVDIFQTNCMEPTHWTYTLLPDGVE